MFKPIMRLTLAVAMCAAHSAFAAQVVVGTANTAEVRGTTTALGGTTLLPHATVTCVDESGRVVGATTSDEQGRFRLRGLPAGGCLVTASLIGFRDKVERLTLRLGQTVERRLDL